MSIYNLRKPLVMTWKWRFETVSRSVMSNSLPPHGLKPARLLCPWDSPGKNAGVGCHSIQLYKIVRKWKSCFREVHNKLWKILKEMGIPDHLACLLKNSDEGQEATIRTNMEQQTGSKSGKKYIKAVYCHPAYLTYIQSTSCEIPG